MSGCSCPSCRNRYEQNFRAQTSSSVKGRYSESRENWHNNVAPHSKHWNASESERRSLADKFGPNWASVAAGLGDQ